MKLALRRGPAPNARWFEKLAAKVIQYRLTTDWPHAGIVVGTTLYHASAKGGLISEPFVNTDNWDLYDCGDSYDEAALAHFYNRLRAGGGKVQYDWVSLLSFTPMLWVAKLLGFKSIRYSNWLYCYEYCYEVLLQKPVTTWVTPENLLAIYIKEYTNAKSTPSHG